MSCIPFGDTQANVQVGKLDTTEVPKAIDPTRIVNDCIEAFTLFGRLAPELRITICELALAAATPDFPKLIRPFRLEPEQPEDCLESAKKSHHRSNTTPNLLKILSTLHVSKEFRDVALKILGILDV
ncbi:hypothetical protein BcDW1_4404 [Botrytis cinerea BcDW1]|nr:hypothetical protein BcDW1_4404 [Botrytis cinerea BcDW1]